MRVREAMKPVSREENEARERRAYVRPEILYREPLETLAVLCSPGKANPGACPSGPISS